MQGVKPWQIVVLVAAVLAIGVSLYFSFNSEDDVEFADSMVMVDLESGQLIDAPFPKGRAVSPPATNPDTKRRTFFPAAERDGKWFVSSRYLPYVKEFVPKPERVLIDAKTGEVKVANDSPKRLNVFAK